MCREVEEAQTDLMYAKNELDKRKLEKRIALEAIDHILVELNTLRGYLHSGIEVRGDYDFWLSDEFKRFLKKED